ncbi:FAD-binding domain-containing protein [Stipitochalara longipes BDJ]|nr:FAD-binding domain-containing protein [Stipitochalara longipes BDJ]
MPAMFLTACRVLLFVVQFQFLASAYAKAPSFNCQPHQSCWPCKEEWQQLNHTLSGRLKSTVMLSSPCFENEPDFNNATCSTIKQNYANSTFRQSVYGATENTLWEACGAANCYPGIVPPQGDTCSLGRLSALYVEAESPSDIITTLDFVKKTGIRMVLKNTGHDSLGRSTAANTLALWTGNLKSMEFLPEFTLQNCHSTTRKNIGIIGAGVTGDEAIAFFSGYGMEVTIGICPTVGIAGGFGQGGGIGPLAPTFGMMVDQAVEFDVITPDGVTRTINECNEPDLFWAMRGGGGQSYAILVNYKFQLHPSTPWAAYLVEATFANNISATQNSILRDVLTTQAKNQLTWTENHISGYTIINPSSIVFAEILPTGSDALGTLKNLTADFNKFITGHPGLNIALASYFNFSNQASFYAIASETGLLTAVSSSGHSVIFPSRLIPRDEFANSAKIDSFIDTMLEAMDDIVAVAGPSLAKQISLVANKVTPFNTPDPQKTTSIHPAWRDALWHLEVTSTWPAGTPASESMLIEKAARAALNRIKGGLDVQAAYLNEADPDEPDWQDVFWGSENYERLSQIKKHYDPDTLLNCWKCVGWLGPQDPMFSCYGNNPVPSVPFEF